MISTQLVLYLPQKLPINKCTNYTLRPKTSLYLTHQRPQVAEIRYCTERGRQKTTTTIIKIQTLCVSSLVLPVLQAKLKAAASTMCV